MSEPKEIKLAYSDFKALLDVLDYIDLSTYALDFQDAFMSAVDPLKRKLNAIEKRATYSKLIHANKTGSENDQLEARIEYLKQKNNPF